MYTLENRLCELASESESASRLKSMYDLNKSRVERYLPSILATFPHYSEHNQNHSRKIISAIERILGENRIKKLTAGDIWLILNCAYMHDIGMIITEKETREVFKTKEFSSFLDECELSSDEDIQKAALHIRNYKMTSADYNYEDVLDLKRDIILLISRYYRPRHTDRVSEHVSNTKSQLYELFNMSFYNELSSRSQHMIGEICMLHGKDFGEIIDQLPLIDTLADFDIHPRLVTVLIRIGDLCDIDNERFNLVNVACFGELTQTDIIHYFKHQTIESMYISPEEINIKADIIFDRIENHYNIKFCEKEKNHSNCKIKNIFFGVIKAHKDWKVWLSEEIKRLKLFWNKIGDNYIDTISLDVNYEILINGEKNITSTKNLRFNFDKEKAFNLIEKSLYNDKMIFARELIQNSCDAIKIQFWRDIIEGNYDYALKKYIKINKVNGNINYSNLLPFDFEDLNVFEKYTIEISAKYNEQLKCGEFNICDNGIGISTSDLENNILKTGISWNERKEYKDEVNSMPEWLKPTGGFGIGLHSVFALTDEIQMSSKSQYEKEGNNIFLSTGKGDGYAIIYKDRNIVKRGTKIYFKCDEEVFITDNSQRSSPFSFKLSDSFAEKVKSVIEKNFINNFFSMIFNDENLNKFIFEDKMYKMLFDKDKKNKILDSYCNINEEFEFAFAFDGSCISIYDKKEHLACVLGFSINNRIECAMSYKNVRLDYEKINYENKDMQILKIDILGNNVKDVILYDRNSLNNKYKCRLKNRLKDIKKFALQIYVKLLSELFKNKTFKDYNEELILLSQEYLEKGDITDFINKTKIFIEKYYDINDFNVDKDIIKTVYMQIFENILVEYDEKIYNLCKGVIEKNSLKNAKILPKIFIDEVKNELDKIIRYILEMKKRKINDVLTRYYNENNDFADKLLDLVGTRIAQVIKNELKVNYEINDFNEYNEEINSTLNIVISTFLSKVGEEFPKLLKVKYEVLSLQGDYTPEINPLINSFNNEFVKIRNMMLNDNRELNYWQGDLDSQFIGSNSLVFCKENSWMIKGENALKFYYNLPIMKIAFMGVCYNLLSEELIELIGKQTSQYSTFKVKEYFSQYYNLTELMSSRSINVAINYINDKMFYLLPFLYDRPWQKLFIKEDVLYIEYNMKDNRNDCIEASEECIRKYIKTRIDFRNGLIDYLVLPAFKKYSNIAIDFIPTQFSNIEFCNNNSFIMLWDHAGNIYEKGVVIGNDIELKEKVVEEIFECEKVQNIIKFIYRYTSNSDLNIKKIEDTYKIFIEDILLIACL